MELSDQIAKKQYNVILTKYFLSRFSCYVSEVPGARVSLGPALLSPICFIEAVKLLSGVARGPVLSVRQLVPLALSCTSRAE